MEEAAREAPPCHDIYKTQEGLFVRVCGNNILVKADKPPKQSKGGIFFPDGAVEHTWNKGTIVAFGFLGVGGKKDVPYKRVPIPDLVVGQRCVFLRYLAEVHTNKSMQALIEEDVFRIQVSDILVVFDAEDEGSVLR